MFLHFNKVRPYQISSMFYHSSLFIACGQTDKINNQFAANVHIFQFVVWSYQNADIIFSWSPCSDFHIDKLLTKHITLFKRPDFYVNVTHTLSLQIRFYQLLYQPFQTQAFLYISTALALKILRSAHTIHLCFCLVLREIFISLFNINLLIF